MCYMWILSKRISDLKIDCDWYWRTVFFFLYSMLQNWICVVFELDWHWYAIFFFEPNFWFKNWFCVTLLHGVPYLAYSSFENRSSVIIRNVLHVNFVEANLWFKIDCDWFWRTVFCFFHIHCCRTEFVFYSN